MIGKTRWVITGSQRNSVNVGWALSARPATPTSIAESHALHFSVSVQNG
jgi:hypothetical protein